jgi:hypothetical protein
MKAQRGISSSGFRQSCAAQSKVPAIGTDNFRRCHLVFLCICVTYVAVGLNDGF